MRAAVSSGRSLTLISEPSKLEMPIGRRRGHGLDRRRAALARTGKRRGAHRADDDLVAGLDRLERVAGIDRAHESVRRLDLDDVRHLGDVEQRGDPRQHVLAGGGGGREQDGIAVHQREHRGADLLGETLRKIRRLGEQDLAHAIELARSFGDGAAMVPGDEDIDIGAELACCGQRLGGRRRKRLVVVLCQQQDGHQRTPASFFNLSTSAATVSTLMPASRVFGSAIATTLSRGEMSTPSASGVVSSIGFFLAFMMLGSEA